LKKARIIPLILYVVLLIAAFSWIGDLFGDNRNEIPYSRVVELFRNEQVKAFRAE